MKYNPDIHRRCSIRLKDYDYSQGGGYFITICTQGRECLFGEIKDAEMTLNAAGKMIENWWMDISKRFEGVEKDEFIVMPNHFHGIVVLVGADRCVCPGGVEGPGEHVKKQGEHIGSPLQNPTPKNGSASLAKIIQWFKTMTTNEYLRNIEKNN